MTLLDRYVAWTLLSAIALVMVVLVVLGMLFVFIGEQGDVGIGHYGMVDALVYSALSVPQFALESFPAGALVGALLGIGVLARSHELTVMRASGMSKLRLGVAALVGAGVLIGISLLIGELLAQPLGQLADERKAFAKYSNISFAGAGGAWLRDGDTILNVQGRSGVTQFGGMLIFDLRGDNRLASIGRAAHATSAGAQSWELQDYTESRFTDDSVSSSSAAQRALHTAAGADLLQLAMSQPRELALHTLYTAIGYLRRNNLDAKPYVFAFWARIARTAGIPAALLFALPFGFGALRAASLSARTTLGLTLGILYFFLQRLVESGSLVFNLNPLLLAWVPTGLLALAALLLLWRVR
ncbi:MAG TPA: LPS export ABC transporter permease LptG [Steroidobacteraceae bacterium]